jgi:hypothetical protein
VQTFNTNPATNQAVSSSMHYNDAPMNGPQVVEAKGAPATAQTSYEPAASTRSNANPQAQAASVMASAIPAHVKDESVLDQYRTPEPSLPARSSYTAGDHNNGGSGASTPLISNEAQQYAKEAERIVEEERLASEKMPHYEGLNDRFQLISKMGDGAFSNVYKARYRKTGQKVAIKVVRKYELNSNQVSLHDTLPVSRSLCILSTPPIHTGCREHPVARTTFAA